MPPRPVRFLADVMLGRLARWLRLLGVETLYADKKSTDDEIIRRAMSLDAILLTRDELLAEKAKDYVRVFRPSSNDSLEQLRQVAQEFRIRIPKNIPETRCAKCGGKLKKVARSSVRGEVYPRVYARCRVFRRCLSCGQIYWRGTHVSEIGKTLRRLARLPRPVPRKRPRRRARFPRNP